MLRVHVDKQEPHQGKDLSLPVQELGLEKSAELKRRRTRGVKCGSQSSFDWEKEMLGTFHCLALGREEAGCVCGLM